VQRSALGIEIGDNPVNCFACITYVFETPAMLRRFSPIRPSYRAFTVALLVSGVTGLVALPLAGAPARKPPPRRVPPKKSVTPTTPAPAPRPAAPTPPPTAITAANLAAILKGQGYEPLAEGEYQRLKVEEEEQDYGYLVDLGLSKSGEWLVCMAHLETIPDLTKVPSPPLLALLAANDGQMGRYFSYNRASGQIMLNAALPTRALTPEALKSQIEAMKETVRDTRGLWDPHSW
jgi:hypothetical protein